MRLCKSCGGEIPKKKRADAQFCDAKCKKREENKRLYVRRTPEVIEQPPCGFCGGVIPAKKQAAKYCSREHMLKAAQLRRKPLEPERDRRRYHADVGASRAAGRVKYENRRGWKYGNPGYIPVTEKDWIRLCNFYKNRCAYCREAGELTQDHVIPLSRGGRHAISNILPACGACNYSKGNKFLAEWRYRR